MMTNDDHTCYHLLPFYLPVPCVCCYQLLLLPILLGESLWALILSNTLYALAFSVYFYVTHLGYRCEKCQAWFCSLASYEMY